MNSKVDLHMHTVVSDGTDTIPELLKKIQTLGITTFAVTDHDAIDGALEMERIVPAEIKFIKGVELSCKTDVAKCHILGYNYDPNHAAFRKFVEEANDVRMNKITACTTGRSANRYLQNLFKESARRQSGCHRRH